MPLNRLRGWFSIALALATGAALRLWFIHAFPQIQGDSLLYGDMAKNWLLHGIYGRSFTNASGGFFVAPTLIRLPGYPAFLALSFKLFGLEHYNAVLYLQAVIDLATCLMIAGLVRQIVSPRAARAALWLAALCPFTANYVAMPLTETLSIFCVALGFYAFAQLLQQPEWRWMLAGSFAWSYAAMLRPDGALLAMVLFVGLIAYGAKPLGMARALRLAVTCAVLALLPFVAWTVRNWRTFHVFQPLAPRYATDPGEITSPGFQRWVKTWMADFASTYEIYWNVPGDPLDITALPSRAFDSPAEYTETRRLFAEYNLQDAVTPQVDAGFAVLAAERVRAHPFRYYLVLPLLRLADMWFRPRVEMLNIELRWWQYSRHRAETRFAVAYSALNLLYLIAAAFGAWRWRAFRGVMLAYIVVRSILLITLEAPEPRYTLECYPILIAFAALAVDRWFERVGTWVYRIAGNSRAVAFESTPPR